MIKNKPKHDELFRKAMENPIVAYEFLNHHIPKNVLALIDIATLKLEKESFVEPNLRKSSSDVLFSAKFNGEEGYIYLLLEHQSNPDRFMAFRLLKYMINICDRHLTMNQKAKHLPLIYPLVLYNGTQAYDVPLNLWELFDNKTLVKELWTKDYHL